MVTFYRRLPRFDYVKPKSMDEALDLLSHQQNGSHIVYSGGTDVVPRLKNRIVNAPRVLVDLKGIPDLDYIDYDAENGLRIGALATIFSVAHSKAVLENYPVLSQAVNSIASTQVQNRGTIVGNICSAVPSADSAPALLCLEAKLHCLSSKRERTIDIDAFFEGPNKTFLKPDELLKEIRIPANSPDSRGMYIKLSPRRRMDLAVVGVGITGVVEDSVFKEIRIGLGAVAPTPIRARKAEDVLNGARVNDGVIQEAAQIASEESTPIDDHRASAAYRKMMVEVLVKRAVYQALLN
jgi:carbon-monoxide dehydrogenase medium subunit